MLIPSLIADDDNEEASLSRRVNANSQRGGMRDAAAFKLIKKGEC